MHASKATRSSVSDTNLASGGPGGGRTHDHRIKRYLPDYRGSGACLRCEFRSLDRRLHPMSVGVVCCVSRPPDSSVANLSSHTKALDKIAVVIIMRRTEGVNGRLGQLEASALEMHIVRRKMFSPGIWESRGSLSTSTPCLRTDSRRMLELLLITSEFSVQYLVRRDLDALNCVVAAPFESLVVRPR